MKIKTRLLFVALMATMPMMNGQVVFAESGKCPPGLAKKNPPCVPPGLAKKGVTSSDWLGRDRVGEIVNQNDLIFLDDFLRYDLRPLPYGQRYAVVDDQIVVIDRESYQILQLIRAFTALSN